MSVYTLVKSADLNEWLPRFAIGAMRQLQGITEGLTNSNYRLSTERGDYILTLIETAEEDEELRYLVALMSHLALRGLPCPLPICDIDGEAIHRLAQRPTLLVTCLPGRSHETPNAAQAAQIGGWLAQMHRCAESFRQQRNNPHGPNRWGGMLARMTPRLQQEDPDLLMLLRSALESAQQELFAVDAPRGCCHADLFPDNALFDGERLVGVIDFHYACDERFVYDLAIALNAWCFDEVGTPDAKRLARMVASYQATRPLPPVERRLLRPALQAAALRFALSRLHDEMFPRTGHQVTVKPPETYIRILRYHREHDIAHPLD
ncbi:homoserine kinase [Magnetofaba australis]|uniref:Homoserine kinase n=1 Tax=Magnetofaba australis IT-1 TaxID=1434232 RepID=A0A1Y2K387_9PROT|nr:homoserine kinase [Magnetofaba australis]OSM02422.1 putative homoserine kinase [Magnetofaba australis IT-1]